LRVNVSLFAAMFVLLTAAADTPPLTALAQIEPGLWTLRSNAAGVAPRTLCVTDPRVLLQLQHPGASCSRFVIANQPTIATVHYSCAGAGNGRTTVRVETPRLIHVESQGVAANALFNWSIEARKAGACPTTAAR
jgi:hypothetical protein